jgi:phosphatidylinositol 4-kinase
MIMLQGDVLPKSMAKNILRQRIYSVALDYFCGGRTYPGQAGRTLAGDIQVMLRFWNMMYSDRKYIKASFVGDEDIMFQAAVSSANNSTMCGPPKYAHSISYPQHSFGPSSNTLTLDLNADAKSIVSEYIKTPVGHGGTQKPQGLGSISGTSQAFNNKRSASRNMPSGHRMLGADHLVRDYNKKRSLVLSLLSVEIEILVTYQNPLLDTKEAVAEALTGGISKTYIECMRFLEEEVRVSREQRQMDKQWKEIMRNAWDISPALAVYLPERLLSRASSVDDTVRNTVIERELTRLVRNNPELVSHIPKALDYFLTKESIENDAPELTYILTWAKSSPIHGLSLLCPRTHPSHPLTAQYAVRVLASYPPDAVLFYIQQLVQTTRWDDLGYVKEFIKKISNESNLVGQQLIWNMEVNMFKDEDGEVKDPYMYDYLLPLRTAIVDGFENTAKQFYEREFKFFNDITSISGIIKEYPKGPQRKSACINALQDIKLEHGCYLPSNPDCLVLDIVRASGQPMQSAAKAPYLATFQVRYLGINKLEATGLKYSEKNEAGAPTPPEGKDSYKSAIFKVGDDCRQDMLALQIIELFKYVFQQVGLDLFLFPYKVVATMPGCGVIECVPDSKSRDQIGRKANTSLFSYFKKEFGEEGSQRFKTARRNFIKSMASYSVLVFLLQIKDRHNGNLMIDKEGHIIHIDFGFMFESSPGGNLAFEPDMKLTGEFVDIMGGKIDAPQFKSFMKLCVHAYLAIRPYWKDIIYLVQLMLDTELPCFRGQTIEQLRHRLQPHLSDFEAAKYMISIINSSFLNFRTRAYDMLQYHQNQIPY